MIKRTYLWNLRNLTGVVIETADEKSEAGLTVPKNISACQFSKVIEKITEVLLLNLISLELPKHSWSTREYRWLSGSTSS